MKMIMTQHHGWTALVMAAAIVLGSGESVCMVPLEVTMRGALSRERFEGALSQSGASDAARIAHALTDFYLDMASRLGSDTASPDFFSRLSGTPAVIDPSAGTRSIANTLTRRP